MAGKKSNQTSTGQYIILAGLLTGLVFFGVFIVTAAIFHMGIRKVPNMRSPAFPG